MFWMCTTSSSPTCYLNCVHWKTKSVWGAVASVPCVSGASQAIPSKITSHFLVWQLGSSSSVCKGSARPQLTLYSSSRFQGPPFPPAVYTRPADTGYKIFFWEIASAESLLANYSEYKGYWLEASLGCMAKWICTSCSELSMEAWQSQFSCFIVLFSRVFLSWMFFFPQQKHAVYPFAQNNFSVSKVVNSVWIWDMSKYDIWYEQKLLCWCLWDILVAAGHSWSSVCWCSPSCGLCFVSVRGDTEATIHSHCPADFGEPSAGRCRQPIPHRACKWILSFLSFPLDKTSRNWKADIHRIIGTTWSKPKISQIAGPESGTQRHFSKHFYLYEALDPVTLLVSVSSSTQCVEIYFYFKFADSYIFRGIHFCKDGVMGFKYFLLSLWGVSWKLIQCVKTQDLVQILKFEVLQLLIGLLKIRTKVG